MQSKHADKADDLLTTGESADIVGVSVDTIKRWERAGKITSLRTPTGHRRFRRGDVEALLQPAGARDDQGGAA
jgi:excisionase family DNA binding protein